MELTASEMRTVFDAFDEDKKGFISTDRFLLLAQEYFGSANREEVKSIGLLEALDPTGSGFINFQAFCQGVQTIHAERKAISSKPLPSAVSLPFSIEDLPSRIASDDDTHSNGTSESTFNEYDDSLLTDMSEDSSPSLLINEVFASQLEPQKNLQNINGVDIHDIMAADTNHLNGHSKLTEVSFPQDIKQNGEEQFEDYGENDVGIEIDVQDLSSAMDATENINGSSATNTSNRRHYRHRSWNGHRPNRRISSKEFANHLYRSTSSNNLPSGAAEEAYGEYAASDSDVTELTDKVRELETQLTFLEKDKAGVEDVQERLKSENTHLQKQKEHLEEQLKELDQRWEETVKEKEEKYSQAIAKQEKEFQQEIISFQNRLAVLQIEKEKLDHEIVQYRSKIQALTQQNKTLETQLQEADSNWLALSVEFQKKEEEYKVEKDEMEDVIHNSNTMIDNLSRQLETLQANHQTELEMKDALMRSPSIADLPSRYQELQHEVKKLRKENQQLKDSNDEINVQLLNSSVQIGRSLLHKGVSRKESFASEMESSSKDEVMQALLEEKKLTKELRTYIGKILEKVIERHPGLLEIEPVRENRQGSVSSETSMKSC